MGVKFIIILWELLFFGWEMQQEWHPLVREESTESIVSEQEEIESNDSEDCNIDNTPLSNSGNENSISEEHFTLFFYLLWYDSLSEIITRD